ncbi:MAG TPA: hypothetical protein VNO55_25150, partial [Polyangia bacterium]|nr:hypothetical protein [Polyangia bacterium]
YLRQAGAGILDGEIQLQGGLNSGAAAISRIDVTWSRPAGAPAPRVIRLRSGEGADRSTEKPAAGLTVSAPGLAFADGVLTLRRLSLPALGGRLTVDGQVRFWQGRPASMLPSPLVGLTLRVDRIDADAVGLMPLFGGRLTMTARLQGPTDALDARLVVSPSSRLVILGEPYAVTAPVELHLAHDELVMSSLPLVQVTGGGASRVDLRGRIGLNGRADVRLTVTDRDLFSLPGLRDAGLPMRGRFDARLRLTGKVTDPGLSGEATIKDISVGNQRLGGGTLTLEEAGHRGARVRGTLFEAFSIDGVLADRAGEPSLNLTVVMQRAALDPLLPAFPPLLAAGHATASGRVSMQMRAGYPALFDGHFTDLGVSYELHSLVPSRRRPARVAIRSAGPVDVHMKGWGTELTLDEAGFDFGAGELRAAGTVRRGVLAARGQGPIDLGLLAPLFEAVVPDQLDGLSGLARADVRLGGTLASPRVQGRLIVDRPIEVGLRALPGARLRLSSGTVLLEDPDALRLEGVAATLRYRDSASLTTADATVRLDLRLGDLRRAGGPSLTGQVAIPSGELTSVALGDTVRIRGGQLDAAGRRLVIRSLDLVSDHHGRVSIGGAGTPPATVELASTNPLAVGAVDVSARGRDLAYGPMAGLKIDAMDVDLRLRGDLRRSVTLSGDVALVAGRYKVDAAGAKPAAPPRPPTGNRPPARARPPGLLDQVALDVHLRSDGQRFVIQHRFVPDLRLRLDLHAGGTAAAPKISGGVGATDIYSWIALLLVRPFR